MARGAARRHAVGDDPRQPRAATSSPSRTTASRRRAGRSTLGGKPTATSATSRSRSSTPRASRCGSAMRAAISSCSTSGRSRTRPLSNTQEPTDFVPAYDIAGNLLFQHSMDAGDRWMLNDAAGKPMLAWDVNQRLDAERRARRRAAPHRRRLRRAPPAGRADAGCQTAARRRWSSAGSTSTRRSRRRLPARRPRGSRNLCGQLYRHYDPGGSSRWSASTSRATRWRSTSASGRPSLVAPRLEREPALGARGRDVRQAHRVRRAEPGHAALQLAPAGVP